MSDVHAGSGAGLLAFLSWAASKGELPEARVSNLRVAVNNVLAIEAEPDEVDIRSIDIEGILDRFEILNRVRYNSSSMQTYRSRFRQAVEMYRAFLEGGTSWKSVARLTKAARSSTGNGARKKVAPSASARPQAKPSSESTSAGATGATVPVQDKGTPLIAYDLPLRPDLIVRLTLPVGLTPEDADRLASFVRSLAFVQPSGDRTGESST
jgi:hypothetical protein